VTHGHVLLMLLLLLLYIFLSAHIPFLLSRRVANVPIIW
jgi:hypothetical protein